MLRTALKPRWLGLLAIVLLVMVSFTTLGLWQLNVARDKGRAEQVRSAPVRPVVDVGSVLTPHGPFPMDGTGRRITATGRYDGPGQVLVTPRRLGGEPGYWVVTPLVVRSTGARIAVVRGFVTDPGQAAAPRPAGEVTVSGTLALVSSGLSWRNAAYALQWWVFALFASYMWWRMVRDDYQDSQNDDYPDSQNDDKHDHRAASAPVDAATTKA